MSSFNWNKILAALIAAAILLPALAESQRPKRKTASPTTMKADAVKVDTLKTDSLAQDTAGKKKNTSFNAPVQYSADDSIVFTHDGHAHLYGNGKVSSQKKELDAQLITMSLDSSTAFARGETDSVGKIIGKPVFKDGDTSYDSKTIRYNFKSKKGIISDVVTQQGEGYVVGNNAKKGANDELFMSGGKYTTCTDHEHPDFYFQMTRAKVRPKKNVITGPAYLVVQDVPLPIAVPFFFFPFTSKYSSEV